MSTVEVLRAARARIDTPEKWHRGEYSDGKGAYCAVGACIASTAEYHYGAEQALERALPAAVIAEANELARTPIPFFNDELATHADVLAMFDRAIAIEEAREQEFAVEPVTVEEPAVV